MKIAISAGHNVYVGNNFDCGSVGNGKRESDITKATVKHLIPLLKSQGHMIKDVTPYNQRFNTNKEHHIKRCQDADQFKSDLYLDIHINAGGGTGVEAWVYSKESKSYPYAEKICQSISKYIGLKNRGVKINPSYWSLKFCKTPAIIVEGAFIDNANDMKKLTPQKYAEAIAACFGSLKTVCDNLPSTWAKQAWTWGIDNKIIDGKRPQDYATREEIITILYRYNNLNKN